MSESIKVHPNGWAIVEDEEPEEPKRRILAVGRIAAPDYDYVTLTDTRRVKVQVDLGGERPAYSSIRAPLDMPVPYALKHCFNSLVRLAREQEAGSR